MAVRCRVPSSLRSASDNWIRRVVENGHAIVTGTPAPTTSLASPDHRHNVHDDDRHADRVEARCHGGGSRRGGGTGSATAMTVTSPPTATRSAGGQHDGTPARAIDHLLPRNKRRISGCRLLAQHIPTAQALPMPGPSPSILRSTARRRVDPRSAPPTSARGGTPERLHIRSAQRNVEAAAPRVAATCDVTHGKLGPVDCSRGEVFQDRDDRAG